MKKIICIALTLVMLLGLVVSASAYDIKVETSADGSGVAGHTYAVYQIFTGDLEELGGTKVLTNVKYGANYVVTGKDIGDLVPKADLDNIAAMGGEAAAEYFNTQKSGTAVATLNDSNGHEAKELAVGYYLIVDITEGLPENETASAFILEVTDDVAIKSKHTSGPIVEKKIDDINDSNFEELDIQWHDSADHDIGDDISFKLEVTIPSAIESFKAAGIAYPFTFHDTEEQGLSFNNDAKVYVDGKEITTGFTVDVDPEDGHSFDVIFADLTQISAVKSGSTISVIYTSELTEQAILGNQGNVNEVFGEFRNYAEPEVPAYTPKDTVIAFTYKVVVNKVDENAKALTGAAFKLEKLTLGKAVEGAEPEATWKLVKEFKLEGEGKTVFDFVGLDDGKYRLTETVTPNGYNTIDPIEFEVNADHEILSAEPKLISLSGDPFTGDVETGALSMNVVNNSGTILPGTGGMGTTLFYILGGILLLGAVVVLVSKKRVDAE